MIAVVPGLFAPLQSLLSFLPQIALALAAAATALFRPQWYRWAWSQARTHKALTTVGIVLLAGGVAGGWAWKRLHGGPPPPPPEEARREGWWIFRGNSARTGGDGSAVGGKAEALWKFRESIDRQEFTSSPAVWAGRVYAGCDNDALYCWDAAKGGDPIWVFATRYEVFSSPTVANGKVYFGEGVHHHTDSKLYCADAVTGRKLWHFQTASHVEDGPTIVEGRAYFGAGDDGIYCIDAETGARVWQAAGRHVDASPLVERGLVIAGAGYGETGVGAWRQADGTPAWFTKLPASCWGPPALGPRGVIVGIGNGNFVEKHGDPRAEILCLSLEGGGIVWRTPLRDSVLASAAVAGDRVYLGDWSGDFGCFDANTGAKLWNAGCGKGVVSSAAVAKDAVVYCCLGGHVHAVAPADGNELWRYDASKDGFTTDNGFFASPAIVDGRVYAGCNNFYFYCFGTR
jgi:outer membrane protein assembly factor BamB